MIDWLFYVPLKNISLLQNLGLCSALRAYEEGGIFLVPHLLWHGTSFFPVPSEGPPHSVAWFIDYLRFYVLLKNFSLTKRRHRVAKFRPMLGAQGLWAGRDFYRATPAVKRDLGFSGLIRRTAPFSRLLRHTRGCGGSILTRILTGCMFWKFIYPGKPSNNSYNKYSFYNRRLL
jgi:hypothetical protein